MTSSTEFLTANSAIPLVRFGRWWFPAWEEQAEKHFVRTPRGCQLEHMDAAMVHVRGWGCAVDGGAHVGSWTLSLAKMFEKVVAFEPHPETYTALIRNMAETESAGNYGFNVVTYNMGLADCPRRASARTERAASMSTKLSFLDASGGIACAALDTIPDVQSAEVGFVKLDLEGCEVLALLGARATLARCRPTLLVECKEKNLASYRTSERALRALLGELGYNVVQEIEQDLICVPSERPA